MAQFQLLSFRRFPVRAYWIFFIVLVVLLKWGHLVSQDEGIALNGAWLINHGRTLYRDFFEFYPPGMFYALAGVFRLFGATYLTAKLFSIALFVFSCYGMWRIGTHLELGTSRYLLPILWLLLSNHYVLINHNTYALMLAIWSLERLLSGIRGSRVPICWMPVATAGGLAGAAVLFHQAWGAALIISGLIFLTASRRYRALWPFMGGALAALLPLLVWPAPMLYEHLVAFPLQHYAAFHRGGHLLIYVVLGGYFALAAMLWRFQFRPAGVGLVWIAGVLLAASSFSHADRFHLLPAGFPAAILLVVGAQSVARRAVRIAVRAVLAASITILAVASLAILAGRIAAVGVVPFLQLRDPQLERLVFYVRENVAPDQPILSLPFLPNFYFETRRRNPTRFSSLVVGLHPPEFFAAARQALENDPPPVALLSYYVTPRDFPRYLVGNPVIDYLRTHYAYVMTINGVQVYRQVTR